MAEAQPDPELCYRPVIYQLLHVSSLLLKTREHYAATVGVTAPQFSVLTAIRESPGTSVGEVANPLLVSGPFVTAEVGKLVRARLVHRQASGRDRRVAELFLIDEGVVRLDAVEALRRAANA
ncbi:MarR family winged helix-turn-helix transcriptional regulator [Paracoccus versutus]|uniref:DNA-binding MarR family transcriptional regulator n=1 Tax=Paracoccus versutus TaxID=34007 RepID=A0A3D9Y1Z2_PARVE|nr:MarR family transcriptional regulator [Paracoccus versutus]REF73199.1 DNA-binding MarR family transcriptional regulator [Paracoccus versutus]